MTRGHKDTKVCTASDSLVHSRCEHSQLAERVSKLIHLGSCQWREDLISQMHRLSSECRPGLAACYVSDTVEWLFILSYRTWLCVLPDLRHVCNCKTSCFFFSVYCLKALNICTPSVQVFFYNIKYSSLHINNNHRYTPEKEKKNPKTCWKLNFQNLRSSALWELSVCELTTFDGQWPDNLSKHLRNYSCWFCLTQIL